MGILDSFDFSFGIGKPKQSKRGSPKVYVSKLSGKRSREYNPEDGKSKNRFGVAPIKGRFKKMVQRYLNILSSDIKTFCSLFKPRVKIVYKEKVMFKDISELTIDDLYE